MRLALRNARTDRLLATGLLAVGLALGTIAITPAPASAGILSTIISIFGPKRPYPYRPPVTSAPEIDPSAARAAGAIVLGGVLALADRRRRP